MSGLQTVSAGSQQSIIPQPLTENIKKNENCCLIKIVQKAFTLIKKLFDKICCCFSKTPSISGKKFSSGIESKNQLPSDIEEIKNNYLNYRKKEIDDLAFRKNTNTGPENAIHLLDSKIKKYQQPLDDATLTTKALRHNDKTKKLKEDVDKKVKEKMQTIEIKEPYPSYREQDKVPLPAIVQTYVELTIKKMISFEKIMNKYKDKEGIEFCNQKITDLQQKLNSPTIIQDAIDYWGGTCSSYSR